MNDDITLPPLPRLQVPRIDADIDLADIHRLAKWCEGVAVSYARAAVEADRKSRGEPVAEVTHCREDNYGTYTGFAGWLNGPLLSARSSTPPHNPPSPSPTPRLPSSGRGGQI